MSKRGIGPSADGTRAMFELLEGPCCDDLACPSRQRWPLPGETFDEFLARLKRTPWPIQWGNQYG